ncbi:hypothetical protein P5673_021286 [Acropora cervicornis]|uniref:Uncharacterized protein n=1 Tax=Acropora cervicornis TaxID=6130 RepID=A0AAD9V0W7_ACRCE|nr:hypothetical protein P5673_021286 [Acropora cervicornis]
MLTFVCSPKLFRCLLEELKSLPLQGHKIMRDTTTAPSPPPSLFAICAQENSKVCPFYPLVFSCGFLTQITHDSKQAQGIQVTWSFNSVIFYMSVYLGIREELIRNYIEEENILFVA